MTEREYMTIFVKQIYIHKENTKEIMSVKEYVYSEQNSVDFHKL